MTIDKRINFRGGGADLGAGASGAGLDRDWETKLIA